MEKQTLVLYPSPAIGHLISMVELGKLILKHHHSFSITILISHPPYNTGSTSPYINHISRTLPAIHFHHLPTVTLSLDSIDSHNQEAVAFEFLRLNNPLVHQALQSISQTSTVKALIIDFFCTVVLDVAQELKIPTFYFFTSGLAFLAASLYLPTLHQNSTKSFKDMKDTYLQIPGIPPILATDMAMPVLDREDKAYQGFMKFAMDAHRSKGIIVNTFESLEPPTLKALRDGLGIQHTPTPPIYCIGPLIADRHEDGARKAHECLGWLDVQPSRSVVFLCFGSLGLFSGAQLKEIAIGLEKSGQRFLWVVRSPPTQDKTKRFLVPPEPDLNVLLPQSFLERTKDRGLVVKSWTPQVEILKHDSVGGFVTHCGWNSVLEAVCAGLPMVAWPLYAEQRPNRVVLVEQMKLALPIEESEDGFVKASEMEKRVRDLMESEEGNVIRERVVKMREEAKAAMSEDGSSLLTLSELAQIWKHS